jgi:hypothetical protein
MDRHESGSTIRIGSMDLLNGTAFKSSSKAPSCTRVESALCMGGPRREQKFTTGVRSTLPLACAEAYHSGGILTTNFLKRSSPFTTQSLLETGNSKLIHLLSGVWLFSESSAINQRWCIDCARQLTHTRHDFGPNWETSGSQNQKKEQFREEKKPLNHRSQLKRRSPTQLNRRHVSPSHR